MIFCLSFMMYSFTCYGHRNISSSHKNTLEFTKDKDVTKTGHCIVGVDSDFDAGKIKDVIKGGEKLKIVISAKGIKDEITCLVNPEFDDSHEIVIRKFDFSSGRTLGIRCDKASSDLCAGLKAAFRDPEQKIKVTISTL